ncbi:GATA transcription factor 15-like [Euphorbia lathyris]|uniref:GATA transcription factor 15-like n=1 Tax=Euphorbia lathyris TaxID=212925 RepID=UPI003313B0CC
MASMMVIDLNQNAHESEETNSNSKYNEQKKSCSDCHTTKTPCWRGGPAGPKTLCNACGIRHRKKTRTLVGLEQGREERNRRKIGKSSRSKLKLGLRISGRDNKLGEEEQAAFLLMALSYGCISV